MIINHDFLNLGLAVLAIFIAFFVGHFIGNIKKKRVVVSQVVVPTPPPPTKQQYQMQGIIPYDDDDDFVTNEKLSIKITHKKLYDDKNIKLLILDDSIDKIFGTTFFISLVCLILDVII